jgi:hypothetical protein
MLVLLDVSGGVWLCFFAFAAMAGWDLLRGVLVSSCIVLPVQDISR